MRLHSLAWLVGDGLLLVVLLLELGSLRRETRRDAKKAAARAEAERLEGN